MVTGSNSADAKSKGPGRPKKGDSPEFDFGSLEFKEAEMPKPASTNPFVKPLGESYEYDTARAVTIPAAGQSRAEGLIRRAADELKIGVSIVAGEPFTAEQERPGAKEGSTVKVKVQMVELTFKGKERRKRKSKTGSTLNDEAGAQAVSDAMEATRDAPAAGTPAAEDTGTATTDSPQNASESRSDAEPDAGKVSVPAAAQ